MTMTKLRNKMIPARIYREKGKGVAITPRRPPTKSYSGKDREDRFWKSLGYGMP